LGSFEDYEYELERKNFVKGELSTFPVEETFKKQLKSYVRMSEEDLTVQLKLLREEKSKPGN
jgi:hypothetical protein